MSPGAVHTPVIVMHTGIGDSDSVASRNTCSRGQSLRALRAPLPEWRLPDQVVLQPVRRRGLPRLVRSHHDQRATPFAAPLVNPRLLSAGIDIHAVRQGISGN